jgi:hypothetical protein
VVLDQLARTVENELDELSNELAVHRRLETGLVVRDAELAKQTRQALDGIDAAQACTAGIDLDALARQRGWLQQLQAAAVALQAQRQELDRVIGGLMERIQALRRRLRVLRRARERRSQRLALGIVRRLQREADDAHVLRDLGRART